MAIQITNISASKPIGFGEMTLLPGETKELPGSFAGNPILAMYESLGFISISGNAPEKAGRREKKAVSDAKAEENAEALRQARIAALEGISDEDLGKMAADLGINPADCKDMADMLKKVKAALRK